MFQNNIRFDSSDNLSLSTTPAYTLAFFVCLIIIARDFFSDLSTYSLACYLLSRGTIVSGLAFPEASTRTSTSSSSWYSSSSPNAGHG